MSAALLVKAIYTIIFVVTGGAVFTDWGRRHPVMVAAAGLVALIGAYYTADSVYNSIERWQDKGTHKQDALPKREAAKPVAVSPAMTLSYVKRDGQKTVLQAKLDNLDQSGLQVWQCEGARMFPAQNLRNAGPATMSFSVDTERNLIGILLIAASKASVYATYDLYSQEQMGGSVFLKGEHACDSFN